MSSPTNLFATVPKRSSRAAAAPFLPMSRAEMDALGWDQCDVIVVTGDAYIDHPSFGMALIGRVLEAQGFRVGMGSRIRGNDVRVSQSRHKLLIVKTFFGPGRHCKTAGDRLRLSFSGTIPANELPIEPVCDRPEAV